jgi:ABC-type Fe3+/spermidine/putrescine transport system ATPase subunit
VFVTHDQEEALSMATTIAVMSGGKVIQVGAPREVYDRPANRFVADFIGETNFIERSGSTIAVRPEQVQVAREGSGLAGEVVAAMVIGPTVQCLVKTDNGQEVLVRQQRRGANGESEALREGERVFLTWDEDAALRLAPQAREETAHA